MHIMYVRQRGTLSACQKLQMFDCAQHWIIYNIWYQLDSTTNFFCKYIFQDFLRAICKHFHFEDARRCISHFLVFFFCCRNSNPNSNAHPRMPLIQTLAQRAVLLRVAFSVETPCTLLKTNANVRQAPAPPHYVLTSVEKVNIVLWWEMNLDCVCAQVVFFASAGVRKEFGMMCSAEQRSDDKNEKSLPEVERVA